MLILVLSKFGYGSKNMKYLKMIENSNKLLSLRRDLAFSSILYKLLDGKLLEVRWNTTF